MAESQPKLTFKEALIKAERFCAYQERCHFEVRQRLKEWGVFYSEMDGILAQLVENNFLNEERFARLFSRSKFNQKQWGRIRITQELKKRRISPYCIRKGLEEIEEENYWVVMQKVAEKRWNQEKTSNLRLKNNKVAKYLIGRGFESSLVWEMLKDVNFDS